MPSQTNDLKKAGLKITLPRMKILEILEAHPEHHMSAEDIYKALLEEGAEIGLATVYRVLTQFEAADLVIRQQFDSGQGVFELISKGDHDHLVCVKSGEVAEFHDPIIEERIAAIAEEHGFDITHHTLTVYGISRSSRKK